MSMGFAFVTFMMPEHAVQAFNDLDGHVFQGRLLHILPAKPKRNPDTEEVIEDGIELWLLLSLVNIHVASIYQNSI